MASQLIINEKVSKSQPVIRALLAKCFPEYKGRKISVRVFANAYTFTEYLGDGDKALATNAADDEAGVYRFLAQPSYSGENAGSVVWTVDNGNALVIHHTRGDQCVNVNVVATGLDTSDVQVLVDALLGGTAVERANAQEMLVERTPGMAWGNLDKYPQVTARDLIFAALEARAIKARKSEAKAQYV